MTRLKKTDEILQTVALPTVCDASGHDITPCGSVILHWRWVPNGTKIHQCEFFVFPGPESDRFDVIFGKDFITDQKLLIVNEGSFVTLVAHKKETEGKFLRIHLIIVHKILTRRSQKTGDDEKQLKRSNDATWQRGPLKDRQIRTPSMGTTGTQMLALAEAEAGSEAASEADGSDSYEVPY